jgi:hypothetical protein
MMATTFSIEKLDQNPRCGICEAFDPMGAGTNSPYRKFRAKAGYCVWTPIKGKMMTVYSNNVPCGKFVMVAIGK